MRNIILLLTLCFLVACNNRQQKIPPAPETPKALTENGKKESSFSKRSGDVDLVEALFTELAESNPALAELEENIAATESRFTDSASAFNQYDQRNNRYYTSARQHAASIKDSLLRLQLETMISTSEKAYSARINPYVLLLQQVKTKKQHLYDLFVVVKLVKTMQLIEKYQQNNLPSAKPVEALEKDIDKLIRKTDSLTKQ